MSHIRNKISIIFTDSCFPARKNMTKRHLSNFLPTIDGIHLISYCKLRELHGERETELVKEVPVLLDYQPVL